MNSLGLTRKAQSGKIGKREVGGYHNEYQWLLISLSEASPLNFGGKPFELGTRMQNQRLLGVMGV